MNTTFGSQTVSFVSLVGSGVFTEYGEEVMSEVSVDVAGCRHRPLSAVEASELFGNVARQMWRTTAPPVAAAVSALSGGRLLVDGVEFHIIGGGQTFEDAAAPFKVTLISEIHVE